MRDGMPARAHLAGLLVVSAPSRGRDSAPDPPLQQAAEQQHSRASTGGWRRVQRAVPFLWFCTSEAVILPSGPEPPSVARSTPSSFASFLAYGVAMTRPSARGAGAGADEGAGGGGGAEGAEGAGAAAVDAATGSGLASTFGASACFTWAQARARQVLLSGTVDYSARA